MNPHNCNCPLDLTLDIGAIVARTHDTRVFGRNLFETRIRVSVTSLLAQGCRESPPKNGVSIGDHFATVIYEYLENETRSYASNRNINFFKKICFFYLILVKKSVIVIRRDTANMNRTLIFDKFQLKKKK